MFANPALLWLIHTDFFATVGDGNVTKMSPRNHSVPISESQQYVIDPANLCSTLDDSIEYRLHIRRRSANDAEHLGCCRLMLQRLAQFRVALFQLFEQPDVLNGDNRLSGEGFE